MTEKEETTSNNAESTKNQEAVQDEPVNENKEIAIEEEDNSTELSELDKVKDELAESKDKYLRLYSEFENFRRRTAKEKLGLVQTANEDLMVSLIPVIDDFERASKSFEGEEVDVKAVIEGVNIVHNKFKKILEQKGLSVMEVKEGVAFDPEFHEAITTIPAPKKKLKDKVVDVIEKGYLLKDKVIRYAKVVIGS